MVIRLKLELVLVKVRGLVVIRGWEMENVSESPRTDRSTNVCEREKNYAPIKCRLIQIDHMYKFTVTP